jgi:hypothetical protein
MRMSHQREMAKGRWRVQVPVILTAETVGTSPLTRYQTSQKRAMAVAETKLQRHINFPLLDRSIFVASLSKSSFVSLRIL